MKPDWSKFLQVTLEKIFPVSCLVYTSSSLPYFCLLDLTFKDFFQLDSFWKEIWILEYFFSPHFQSCAFFYNTVDFIFLAAYFWWRNWSNLPEDNAWLWWFWVRYFESVHWHNLGCYFLCRIEDAIWCGSATKFAAFIQLIDQTSNKVIITDDPNNKIFFLIILLAMLGRRKEHILAINNILRESSTSLSRLRLFDQHQNHHSHQSSP